MRLQSYERRNTEHRVPLHIVGASVVKGCEGYTEGEVEELALKVDAGVSVEVQGVPRPQVDYLGWVTVSGYWSCYLCIKGLQ